MIDGPFLASAFSRCIERVLPCAVIGGVDDADDIGETGPKKTFNALSDGDLGKTASLAAAFKADARAACGDVDQVHSPAVGCDGGVHFVVEDPAHMFGEVVRTSRYRSHPRPHDAHFGHLRYGRTEERFDL